MSRKFSVIPHGVSSVAVRSVSPFLRLNHNRVCVRVKDIVIDALIDTGSDVTIVSESFRKRIRTVATPWGGGFVRGADDTTFIHQPVGQCTFRVTMGGREFTHQTVVFPKCGHDLILGWDFLSTNVSSLDCVNNALVFSSYEHNTDVSADVKNVLISASVANTCVLLPDVTNYVNIVCTFPHYVRPTM